jgi:transposase
MRYLRGTLRYQQSFLSIDDQISKGHLVRRIDDLCEDFCSGITFDKGDKETGRKAYHPADLLKILVYGYFNGISSSRKLEREAGRNIELGWLTGGLVPDHKTISDFRGESLDLISSFFKYLVLKFKAQGLITGTRIAVDGTKIKAYASKEVSLEGIKDKLDNLEHQANNYLQQMEVVDKLEDDVEELEAKKAELQKELEVLADKKKEYQALENSLRESGETKRSISDPESKIMRGRYGTYWGYNAQCAIDTHQHFITAVQVGNHQNDKGLLKPLVEASELITEEKVQESLADGGYYKINQIAELEKNATECFIKVNRTPTQVKDQENGIKFTYDAQLDQYHCQEGKPLIYARKKIVDGRNVKVYRGTECNVCPIRDKCTTAKQRIVHRNENQEWIDSYHQKMNSKVAKERLRERRMVAEHPFGTMKYYMGHVPLLLRGQLKVQTEISLYAIGYNLKRYYSIITLKGTKPPMATPPIAA